MSGKLVIVAAEEHFEELAGVGEFPPAMLHSPSAGEFLSALEAPPPWIVRGGYEYLSQSGATEHDTRRHYAELTNHFGETTACYLAVLGQAEQSTPSAAPPRDPEPDVTPDESPDSFQRRRLHTIAEHLAWHRAFRRQLLKFGAARVEHVRHVLILVATRPLPAAQYEDLQALTAGQGADRLFDAVYLMQDELEPGRAAGELFYAEDVWPIAVGGLLWKLLHDPPRPSSGPTQTFAWRSYRLAPHLPQRREQQLIDRCFSAVTDQLVGDDAADPRWDLSALSKGAGASEAEPDVELGRPRGHEGVDEYAWTEWPVRRRVEEVLSRQRWSAALVEAGGRLGGRLSGRSLEEEPAARAETAKIWRSVHEHPRFVSAAMTERDILQGPPLDGQFARVQRCWQTMLAADDARRAGAGRLQSTIGVMRDAQLAMVGWPGRLLAAVTVLLAVCLWGLSCLGWFLEDWTTAWVTMVCCLLGAVGAAVGSWYLENRAGRRSQRQILDWFAEQDQLVRSRHAACQDSIRTADQFRQQLEVKSAAASIRLAMSRLRRLLEHELVAYPVLSSRDTPPDADDGGQPPAPRALRREQRLRKFLQRAALRREIADDEPTAALDSQREVWEELCRAQADWFLRTVWRPFCERHDPHRLGRFPAERLIPVLRWLVLRVEQEVLSQTSATAVTRLTADDYVFWSERLREVLMYQAYFELMSCRLMSHQTAAEEHRPAPMLYLRRLPGADDPALEMDGAAVQQFEPASEYFTDTSLVGLLHQQLPLRLGVVEGVIAPISYQD